MDDVTQLNFFELSDWFITNWPEIPVCCFLWRTHEWNEIGWERAKEMIEEYNWEIGGHTRSHPYLTLLRTDEITQEIMGNIRDIEKGLENVGLDYKVSSFAYPFGDFDERVKEVLKSLNIPVGLTYPDGFPYKSLLHEANINSLEIGITTDWKPLPVLNNRFDKLHKTNGIYCLCLHTRKWRYGLIKDVRWFLRGRKMIREFIFIFYKLFRSQSQNGWKTLDAHINYIKGFSDIEFLTFRDLLGGGQSRNKFLRDVLR